MFGYVVFAVCILFAVAVVYDTVTARRRKGKPYERDEQALQRLFFEYLDNLFAYVNQSKILNVYTGERENPDERLMRSIEKKINIRDRAVDCFREDIAAFMGAVMRNRSKHSLKWDVNPELAKALELHVQDRQNN